MIEVVNGDVLESDADIIAHQTNCLGIMGGGVALQIRKLCPNVYREYVQKCSQYKDNPASLLGEVQLVKVGSKWIANCFGQNGCSAMRVCTDYNALDECFEKLFNIAKLKGLSIAMPYMIGCGLAGGDWGIVYSMLQKYFDNNDVQLTLYKYQG